MRELVFYLNVAPEEAESATETLKELEKLGEVETAQVYLEERERNIDIQSITLTITALSGAVGATSLLLDKVRDLVKSIRGLRAAFVETAEGAKPLEEVAAADLTGAEAHGAS